MAYQTEYPTTQRAGYPGMQATMEEWNAQGKTATGPIAFGAPVQRDGAKGCKTFAAGGEFLGIAAAHHVAVSGTGDQYDAPDEVPIADEGHWFVKIEGNPTVGGAANYNTATRAFTTAAAAGGIIAVPGVEIESVDGAALGTVRVRRVPG